MSATARCSKCGAPVSDEVAGGFCTACLLEEGLTPTELKESPIAFKYFGDYELIEEIARGGMGVVFKARQRSLNRIVAVKMILSGHLASEAEAQRFRAEARATAALPHPGIVAIHEVGEHEGLLFFSMDWVEGQNLAQVVRDGPLSATRAAECVRDIADAIHYAHERGVLHRDLKPSNVLIDAIGKPHVTDFGLAKRLVGADVRRLTPSESSTGNSQFEIDQSLLTSAPTDDLTLSGQLLGSPNFMPPEQAAGKHRELTPASDVYSLGALLYHLLTGRPPFLAENIPATLRLVAEAEPVAPRLLAPGVPRDLETICLKCLEKDPQCRYTSANELAEELKRFRNHEPIRARPIGVAGKLWRWSRRNPGLARTATAALVLFLAVTIGGPIAVIQINRARHLAEARQKEATIEATRSLQYAQFLKEMLRSAGPSVARGRDSTLLRELLAKTADRVDKELRGQPEIQADILLTLGNTYRDIGDYKQAVPILEKAVASYRAAFGSAHKKLAIALGQLGSAQSFIGDITNGKRNSQAGLEIARRCNDPETLATSLFNVARSLDSWGMSPAESLPYASEAAEIRRKLGDESTALADCLSFMAGAILDRDGAEAERLTREALALNLKHLERDHPSVVSDIFMLGQVQLSRGNYAEAEVNLKETLRLYRKIHDENHPYRSIVLRLLGDALTKQGKQAELEAIYREEVASFGERPASPDALAGFVAILKEHSKSPEAEQVLLQQLSKLDRNRALLPAGGDDEVKLIALVLKLHPKSGEAEALERRLASHVEKIIEASSTSTNLPATIDALGSLCYAIEHAGKYALAESLLNQRLALQRRLHGNEHKDVLDSLGWMAEIRSWGGKPAEAAQALQEKIDIQTRLFGRENTNVLVNLDWLADLYEQQDGWEQSEPLRQELLATRKKLFGADHPQTVRAARKLAGVLLKQQRFAEAEIIGRDLIRRDPYEAKGWDVLRQALDRQGKTNEVSEALREQVAKFRHAKTNELVVAEILDTWADHYASRKNWNEAETCAEQALEIRQRVASTNLPPLVGTLARLCGTLDNAHKYSKAQPLIQRMLAMQHQIYATNELKLVQPLGWAGWIFQKDNKYAEAQPLFEERLAIQRRHLSASSTNLIESINWLVWNLEKQDKTNEAEALKKELAALRRNSPTQPSRQ